MVSRSVNNRSCHIGVMLFPYRAIIYEPIAPNVAMGLGGKKIKPALATRCIRDATNSEVVQQNSSQL